LNNSGISNKVKTLFDLLHAVILSLTTSYIQLVLLSELNWLLSNCIRYITYPERQTVCKVNKSFCQSVSQSWTQPESQKVSQSTSQFFWWF